MSKPYLVAREFPQGFVILDKADAHFLNEYPWNIQKKGRTFYVKAWKAGKWYSLHRLVIGAKDGEIVDHINRNGMDNSRANLRIVTTQINMLNRDITRANTSGYRGVSYNDHRSMWRASIKHNYKQRVVGDFSSPVEAAKAWDKEALRLRGEHAQLNFPVPAMGGAI